MKKTTLLLGGLLCFTVQFMSGQNYLENETSSDYVGKWGGYSPGQGVFYYSGANRDYNQMRKRGVYRVWDGTNGPFTGNGDHTTALVVSQSDDNYGFQLSSATGIGGAIAFRNFAGTGNFGQWNEILHKNNFKAGEDYLGVDSNGNVGIGTTNLDIQHTGIEDLVIGDGIGSRGLVVNAGGTSTDDHAILAFAKGGEMESRFMYNTQSGILNYYKRSLGSNGNVFTIDNNGKVGVRTGSKSLNINHTQINDFVIGNGSGSKGLVIDSGNNSGDYAIMAFANAGSMASRFMYNGATGKLNYYKQDINKYLFTIDNVGNVGIGTSSPSTKLEVFDNNPILRIKQDPSTPGAGGIEITAAGSSGPKAYLKLHNGGAIWGQTGGTGNDRLEFGSADRSTTHMTLLNGNLGIGTTNPQNELSVNGTIWATEVKVSLTNAADYVFEEDYKLRSLEEVESFVKENKHLPEIPSAQDFKENDMKVSEMTNKLLQKIEELTLYTIEQEKKLKTQEERLQKLEALLAK